MSDLMSAFGGKADMVQTAVMSAIDPKRHWVEPRAATIKVLIRAARMP